MSNEVLTQYKRYRARNRRFISAMVLLLAVTGIVSLIIGSHRIGWQELWAISTKRRHGNEPADLVKYPVTTYAGSRNYRDYPIAIRSDHANFVNRNPLASPYTLGISKQQPSEPRSGLYFWGAGAGITRSSDLFMITNPYVITLSAFLGSLLGWLSF